MTRSVIGLVLVALAATPTVAQTDPPPKDGKVVIPMLVSPAESPVPASKYYVYPEYRDSLPGNKVQGLLRSFMEQRVFFSGEQETKRHKFLEMSLAELPANVREQCSVNNGIAYPAKYTSFLANADKAARYTRTEWNEWQDIRKDGIYYLLPELQQLRSLAYAVRLRMRGEVKAGEWSRAVESAKTLFGMAQAMEQHPTLIGNLVGMAVVQSAVAGLEEMAAQPSAPSLFWSLTDLPSPPVSIRHGMAGERVFLVAQFGGLMAAKRPLSDAELAPYLAELTGIVKEMSEEERKSVPNAEALAADAKGWFTKVGSDPARRPAALKRIAAQGLPVEGLQPVQVGLMDELFQYVEQRDELYKAYNLPYWQAEPVMKAADETIRASKDRLVFAPLFVASANKVKRSETRLTARVAQLRIVEAIRLHAKKTGKLPTALNDIELPLPVNPYTGQPFTYAVTGDVAMLGAVGQEADEKTNRWFEIRLVK